MRIAYAVIEYFQESSDAPPLRGFFEYELLPFYGAYFLSGIRPEAWQQMVSHAAANHHGNTVVLRRALRKFLVWCRKRGLIKSLPADWKGIIQVNAHSDGDPR
jgi:hypothetical protein